MSDHFTPTQLLSHLQRCGECGYYIGAPVLCKGQSDVTKKGFWYEKCLNNAQPTPDTCTFFQWRPEIVRGKPAGGKKTPCPGALCRQANKPNTSNLDCTFGVCVKCCRHLQPLLDVVRSCSISDHRKGVVYPGSEAREDSQDATASQRRGRGRPKKSKKPGSDAIDPPPKHQSYATPVGGPYLARMSVLDAERRLEVERNAEQVKQDRAQAHLHIVALRWWANDGEEPEHAEVVVDNPSAFHPKDVPYLVDRYQCDTQPFQYYDSKKRVWYTGTRFSAARDLKKISPDDICYRSQGVTSGEGMPCPSKKRPAPDDTPSNDTPRRPLPPFTQGVNGPASTPQRSCSPTATEPPMSGSSTFSVEAEYDPFFNVFDFTPTTSYKDASTHDATNLDQPRLPALFPADTDITQHIPPNSTRLPDAPSFEIDLDSAPRGRSASGWPWRYVCDMAAGFAAIRQLEDSHPPVPTPEAFKTVFKAEYKVTTYGDQKRAWRAAALVTGERDRWIQYGRSEAGEWRAFMRSWRQGQ